MHLIRMFALSAAVCGMSVVAHGQQQPQEEQKRPHTLTEEKSDQTAEMTDQARAREQRKEPEQLRVDLRVPQDREQEQREEEQKKRQREQEERKMRQRQREQR